ncbi:MAG: mechanosensitive ion channel family protein [Methyloligellaceae bacterium]
MAKTPEVVSAADHIQAAATQWSETFLPYMLSLVTAIIVLIAGFFAARFASRLIRSRMEKVEKIDKTLIPVVAQLSHYTILIFTLILVLAEFGIQTTSIIAVLGAAGLAIGLALQGTLQNVAAGIMLLIIRPFQVGDYIEAGGASATVDEIGLFMTRMHTAQGIFIAVPNSKIWSDTIVNYSKRAVRRLDIHVGISYDDDIDHAIEVLTGLIQQEERILNRPEPRVIVKALGESSVDLEIRAWAKGADFWATRFDLMRAIKYRLDEEDISIPYPHRQVIMQDITDS